MSVAGVATIRPPLQMSWNGGGVLVRTEGGSGCSAAAVWGGSQKCQFPHSCPSRLSLPPSPSLSQTPPRRSRLRGTHANGNIRASLVRAQTAFVDLTPARRARLFLCSLSCVRSLGLARRMNRRRTGRRCGAPSRTCLSAGARWARATRLTPTAMATSARSGLIPTSSQICSPETRTHACMHARTHARARARTHTPQV